MPYAFDQIFREFKIVVEKELKRRPKWQAPAIQPPKEHESEEPAKRAAAQTEAMRRQAFGAVIRELRPGILQISIWM